MQLTRKFLVKGAAWTIGAYGISQLVRFVANVILTRLLAPELFGIMLIVNSLATGASLISDLGLGQNIVQNPDAEKPDFYNTVWTIQVIRGFLLWAGFTAAALPLARFYESPELSLVMPIAALGFLAGGLRSIGYSLLQKRMQLFSLNLFDVTMSIIGASSLITLALITPTVWALVFGALLGQAAYAFSSYFLVKGLKQRFHISKEYLKQIMHFGIWIFLSSIVYFLSTNLDRLYLAKAVPLELLGVYGLARSISELLGTLVLRLAAVIVFPLIASLSHLPRAELRQKLSSPRLKLLLVAALGSSLFASVADILVNSLYDQRYHAAGWMVPIMIFGVWISTLCGANEAILLGLGKPSFAAIGNSLKFGYLVVGLPLSFTAYGILGSLVVIATSDVFRYFAILAGQRLQRVSFGLYDGMVTAVMLCSFVLFEWLRCWWGFGTSLDGLRL